MLKKSYNLNSHKNKTETVLETDACFSWRERSEKNLRTGLSWQKGYGTSNSYSVQPWWAEEHLKISHSRRRAHQGQLLSVKKRNLRLPWAQDWKNLTWSFSWFLMNKPFPTVAMTANFKRENVSPASAEHRYCIKTHR